MPFTNLPTVTVGHNISIIPFLGAYTISQTSNGDGFLLLSHNYPNFPLVSQIIINHKPQITSYWGWFWMVLDGCFMLFSPCLVLRLHGHDAQLDPRGRAQRARG